MLISPIKCLMKRKYNNYRVYFHNFSTFDSVFLVNTLSNLSGKIAPVIKDGIIIQNFILKIIKVIKKIIFYILEILIY